MYYLKGMKAIDHQTADFFRPYVDQTLQTFRYYSYKKVASCHLTSCDHVIRTNWVGSSVPVVLHHVA